MTNTTYTFGLSVVCLQSCIYISSLSATQCQPLMMISCAELICDPFPFRSPIYTWISITVKEVFFLKYHSYQVPVIWQIKSWFVLRIFFTLYIIKVKAMEGWEYTPVGRGMGDHTPSQSMKSKKYYKVEIFDEIWLLKSIF